ncbi:MAG TPA: ABC transporter permease [Acidimicrobiia bacterium]|nr:ABC transporter permease [Acidimicrobiia bacterium]
MSPRRILVLLRKDVRLGPRSPVFLWVLVLPLLITLVLQVAFGDLFDPSPRLGIVDRGASAVTGAARRTSGIEVILLDDVNTLKEQVEANDLDAGLVLAEGFDAALRVGGRPRLEFYVGGQSLASTRIVLAVTTLDLVRRVEGQVPPVDVEVVSLGEESLPITVRLVPFVAMYALLVAGVFLPSFSLADEREKRTLDALVVTPVRLGEVVVAKGILGFALAVAMTIVTLWINRALTAQPLALAVVLLVAGLLLVELGLVYGTVSKNITAVFTLIKGTGFLLLAPTVFYIFPDWPQWIAKLFPTYWVINPVYEVTINRAGLGSVWVELLIALGVAALLAALVVFTTRRLRAQLAAA